MSALNLLRLLMPRLRDKGRISYAQCGEDLIVATLLELLNIDLPTYLDIGAHHPSYLSNTYFFYRKGCQGVCVEPDPALCENIQRVRERDVCLSIGIGTDQKATADFYILNVKTLNTFSRQEAETQLQNPQHKIERILKVPLRPINEVIREYFSKGLNFLSLDTEGMDLGILNSLDFGRYRPQVCCIETLTHPGERKVTEVANLMREREYLVYADTYINTIFVDAHSWKQRGLKDRLRLNLSTD